MARQVRSISAKLPHCISAGSWFCAWASSASISGPNPARSMVCSLAPPAMRVTAVISRPGLVTCPIAAWNSSAAIAWSCRGIICSAVIVCASSVRPLVARPKLRAFSSSARTFSALRMTGTRRQSASPPTCALTRC